MTTFRIHSPDDESMVLFMNDEYLGTWTHDSDGWQGIQQAKNLLEQIADKLGAPVDYTDGPDEDYED